MLLKEFDYNLPRELIAQVPSERRELSRMMVLDKSAQTISHKHFYDITDFLDDRDLLVLNDTKVIPARLFAQKENKKIEVFLLKQYCPSKGDKPYGTGPACWQALIKPAKKVSEGDILTVSKDFSVKIIEKNYERNLVELICEGDVLEALEKAGNVPLPPYIERKLTNEQIKNLDFERYQTVFAKNKGSVAAPTAGLHFTSEILQKLEDKGVETCCVTLNVGLGTFRPVKCEEIEQHKMDSEMFEITPKTAQKINEAKAKGKNIVCVGTTSVRALETTFQKLGKIDALCDFSTLFIYPPYKFQVVDKLLTNFHIPKSTLLMLTSAFGGKEFIFKAYEEAVKREYRFYSYGDCMLIN